MNENNGFIKLHRKILKWEWYQETNVFRVFLHLLLKANHAPARWQGIEIKAGQLVTSYRHLAAELDLSPDTVHRAIKKLVSTGEIEVCPNARNTIITLKNYIEYQDSRTLSERSPNDSRTLPERKPNQTRIIENNKNNKNDIHSGAAFTADYINSVISDFNSVCVSLQRVDMMEYKHGALIRSAAGILGETTFRELFSKVEQSDFLSGRAGGTGWRCSLDWILKPENLSKILAGNYDNKVNTSAPSAEQPKIYDPDDLWR